MFIIPTGQSVHAFFIPLFLHLIKNGVQVFVISDFSKKGNTFSWKTSLPPEVKKIDYPIPRIPNPLKIWNCKRTIEKIILTESIEMVSGQFLMGSILSSFIKKDKAIFRTSMLHSLVEKDFPLLKRTLIKALEIIIILNSDWVWVLNKNDEKRVKWCKRTSRIPGFGFGVDFERFQNSSNLAPASLKSIKRTLPTLLFTGRLIPGKGIFVLFRAMKDLNGKVQLLICGDVDPAYPIKLEEIPSNVFLFGWQNDLVPFFKKSHFFIFPSKREAISVGVMEAMYNGLPVIGTNVKGVGELIEDTKDGFLIRESTPKGIITTINQALSYFDQLELMSENVRSKAIKHFDRTLASSIIYNDFLEKFNSKIRTPQTWS
ncbi:MAG: glycosyltransferase [Bacteroidota bacterium]|nr:glycosyltransferase [Bacteroidota bacterium]